MAVFFVFTGYSAFPQRVGRNQAASGRINFGPAGCIGICREAIKFSEPLWP